MARKGEIDRHLRRDIARWLRLWSAPLRPEDVVVELSPRLRTSVGRALPARRVIRLHPALGEAPSRDLREVLCHELAHVAVHALHGTGTKPHGPEWAELVTRAGFDPAATLASSVLDHLREEAHPSPPPPSRRPRIYLHTCPVCHAARRARRPVPQWRCAACVANGLEGLLDIERLPLEPAP